MSDTIHSLQNRGLAVPTSGLGETSGQVNVCLEIIKREFKAAVDENTSLRLQRDAAERKLLSQIKELETIRQALYDLEAHQARDRQKYEDEIREIRNKLHDARQQAHSPGRPPGLVSIEPRQSPFQCKQAEPLRQAPPQPGIWLPLDKRTATLEPEQRQQELFESRSTSNETPTSPHRPQPPSAGVCLAQQQITRPSQGVPARVCGDSYSSTAVVDSNAGDDWVAQFNVHVPQILEVELMHTLWHDSVVCCVRFSRDGQLLATACHGSAQIYDVKTGRKIHVLVEPNASTTDDTHIRCVCFSPDGKYLATGAEDRRILVWDILSEQPAVKAVLEDHEHGIQSLQFSPDGTLLVSGSLDRTVRIWDVERNHRTTLAVDGLVPVEMGVTSVAISPNGRLVAAGFLHPAIHIWDLASRELVACLEGHQDAVHSVVFTPDAKGLVSGSFDKTIKLWDVASLYDEGMIPSAPLPKALARQREAGESCCACLLTYQGHQDYVLSAAVSYDGRWIVSGSKDRDVQFWDARTAVHQLTLRCHKNTVFSVDLDPTGVMLATGSGDSQARIWRFSRRNEL